jgi:hypothetical protein
MHARRQRGESELLNLLTQDVIDVNRRILFNGYGECNNQNTIEGIRIRWKQGEFTWKWFGLMGKDRAIWITFSPGTSPAANVIAGGIPCGIP